MEKAIMLWAVDDSGKEYQITIGTNNEEYVDVKRLLDESDIAEPNTQHIVVDHDEYEIIADYEMELECLIDIAAAHSLAIYVIEMP